MNQTGWSGDTPQADTPTDGTEIEVGKTFKTATSVGGIERYQWRNGC